MQDTSLLYRQILADANHRFEAKVSVGGIEFTESDTFSIQTFSQMFSGSPEVGSAVVGEIDVSISPPAAEIPTMAQIIPYVRACTATQQSEWIQQGVFYVDTRELTQNNDGLDILTLHGYDAMLKTEQEFQSSRITGTSTDTAMVAEIARIIGVSVDARTWDVMTDAYSIPLPVGYSLREILGYIAGAYFGCFIITEQGKLRLVSLLELPPETNLLVDQVGDHIVFGGDRILV